MSSTENICQSRFKTLQETSLTQCRSEEGKDNSCSDHFKGGRCRDMSDSGFYIEDRRMDIVAVQVQSQKKESASISFLDFSGAIFYATHRVELESFLAPHKNKPPSLHAIKCPIGTNEATYNPYNFCVEEKRLKKVDFNWSFRLTRRKVMK
jgi:hypothetical protein